jgi:signal recognition particle subunit SRP54
MFESLSSRIQDVFQSLRGEVRLTEDHVESALREIRLALLEADVNFKVVKAFVDRVRDKAMDQAVLKSLSPGQQVIKIVRDELLALFGDAEGGLHEAGAQPACRPAARAPGLRQDDDLGQARALAHAPGTPSDHGFDRRAPAGRHRAAGGCRRTGGRQGLRHRDDGPGGACDGRARRGEGKGYDTVIVDTAGRLHIDDELMHELQAIKDAVQPSDLLYVADAMTGQDAIKSAGEFNHRVGVTGVVLTKLDGDARGGAALSVVSVVGVPIAFVGSGERIDDLELFHPDRIVSRMLGMGDVLSLIEKAEQVIDEDEAEELEEKLRKNAFTLDDFRKQFKTIRKMGPLESILGMIPGLSGMKDLAAAKPDEKQMGRIEAIICSMTPEERRNEKMINGSRRKRIAKGSGTSVEDVNRLLKQFQEMKRVLGSLGQGGMPKLPKGMAGRIPALPGGRVAEQMVRGGNMPGGGIAHGGKKRKKGGPWGLIKTR